jgi:hypothetical protein
MSKHMFKAGLMSQVLRCHCVRVGQGFGDFLDLCEMVFFLLQYRGVVLLPADFFYHLYFQCLTQI